MIDANASVSDGFNIQVAPKILSKLQSSSLFPKFSHGLSLLDFDAWKSVKAIFSFVPRTVVTGILNRTKIAH